MERSGASHGSGMGNERDVEITTDLVSALIAEQFPLWSGRAVKAVDLTA